MSSYDKFHLDIHPKNFVENMLILGIETSCDDTSAAIVENGNTIISNIVSNQDRIHEKYGGIVPELASRSHIEMIWPVVDEALRAANITLQDISAIAFSHGPGLIGSLLVGTCFAKSVSYVSNIPLLAVNHLEGHIFSIFLEATPDFPFLALVVSGGHTSIYLVNDFNSYEEIARTRDDAAGEAYDKVAKLLGFGYPGGPTIDKLAIAGNPETIRFPRANVKDSYDFSFSGLKTAVLNYSRKNPGAKKEDIAAAFQDAVVDVLTERLFEVSKKRNISRIVLSGGVSANSGLRKRANEIAQAEKVDIFLPSISLCTDNAAMIAAAGYHYYIRGETASYTLNPTSYLPLGSTNR